MVNLVRARAGQSGIAVMLVAIATVLQALAIRLGGVDLPLLLYYPLLAAIAWLASFGFGVAATLASAGLIWLLFLSDPSVYTASLPARLVMLAAFVLTGVVVSAMASSLRGASVAQRWRGHRDALLRRRYETVLGALPCGVLASDARGRAVFVNDEAAALLGGAPRDLTGRPVRDLLGARDAEGREAAAQAFERVLSGLTEVASTRRWLRQNRCEANLAIVETAAPMRDAAGAIRGAVLMLQDAAAAALRDAVVDAAPDAIVGIDAQYRVVSWNRAAQRLFGYDEHEAVGLDAGGLIAARWRIRHPLPARPDAAGDDDGPVDVLCVRRDGARFRATLAAGVVPPRAGGAVALSLTIRESGERRRRDRRAHRSLRGARDARRQADTSNRLKDELLATVSHELRTPLNVIYGWVEVLRHTGDLALQQQAIDAIDRSARSLTRMVADILDASSLATGKLRLDAVPIDLVRIVADVAESFRTAAANEGIGLATECAVDTCVVSGDGERLRQMLSNLLSNAFKFTPTGGRVTVALALAGARVTLSVADTGAGIAPEFVPHVFEAFRRADEAPASPRRGLGLGLSIVRHIVELHGGKVSVRSAGRNLGATFTVALPAGWQPPLGDAVGHASRDEPTPLVAQRVLLVDDDPTTRASLAAALTTLGAEVCVAASGREALAQAERARPTVVLSDLAMPDGDGFWLLEALRRRGAGGPRILAVTAHAGQADERRAREAGFDGYLRKPVDLQMLARVIVRD